MKELLLFMGGIVLFLVLLFLILFVSVIIITTIKTIIKGE